LYTLHENDILSCGDTPFTLPAEVKKKNLFMTGKVTVALIIAQMKSQPEGFHVFWYVWINSPWKNSQSPNLMLQLKHCNEELMINSLPFFLVNAFTHVRPL